MPNKATGREEIIVPNLPEAAVLSIAAQGMHMECEERNCCMHDLEETAVQLAGQALAARDSERKAELLENYRQHTAVIRLLAAFA